MSEEGKSSDPLVVQPVATETLKLEDNADAARERWKQETAAQDAAPEKDLTPGSDAEAMKEHWKAKWSAESKSLPTSTRPSPGIVGDPSKYFASGEAQEFQCVVRCGEFTYEEKQARKERIIPCFVNGPCLVSEPCAVPDCLCNKGGQWRCCSRAGNFTVLLERLVPRGNQPDVELTATSDAKAEGGDRGDDIENMHQDGSGAYQPLNPRRELWLVMGPYWPFCLSLTTNLTVLIPAALVIFFWAVLPVYLIGVLIALAGITLVALASVACRDPGLVPHYWEEPEESKRADPKARPSQRWIFNDLTRSWRPRGAVFDRDVNAVVRGFDHVCPFTGTAIGENNLTCFYAFVVCVQGLIYTSIGIAAYGFYVTLTSGYSHPASDSDD